MNSAYMKNRGAEDLRPAGAPPNSNASPLDWGCGRPHLTRGQWTAGATMPLRVILLICISTAASSGCTAWHRRDTALDQLPTPATRVQIWAHGHAYDLHGLVLRSDSVFGIPYWKPASCDSCRIGIPRSDVDSARVRQESYGRNRELLVAGFLITVGALLVALGHGWAQY